MHYKIMMVDDEPANIKATKVFLEMNGFDITSVSSAEHALGKVTREEFALVLLDYQMPNLTGALLANRILELNPSQQIAIYSCDLSRDALKRSYQSGVIDFIEKHEDPQEILNRVRAHCHRHEMVSRTIRPIRDENENRKIISSIEMVGQSTKMAAVAMQVHRLAAANDVTVLIQGETGTGKELIAKALHDLSPRARGPFVAINCTAIPRDLLESTLFGHRQGAFTGATSNQDGKFVQAHGGTLFLDEIGDLSMDLQAKLLRVLQERIVEPLGSRTPRKIDVRIVCATHKRIHELVKKGLFREDLMYRINVTEVKLPALRDRPEDIEPLVGHFTNLFCEKYGFNKSFQYRTLEVLKKYPWPGNVRELSSIVEKHLVQATGSLVKPEDLDLKLYEFDYTSKITTTMTLAELEEHQNRSKMNLILRTVEKSTSKADAARRLGIKPNHLQFLLNDSKASRMTEGESGSSVGT